MERADPLPVEAEHDDKDEVTKNSRKCHTRQEDPLHIIFKLNDWFCHTLALKLLPTENTMIL